MGTDERWTLWDALRTFSFRSLAFALVFGALAAAGGAAVAMNRTAVYSTTSSLLIDQPAQLADSKDEGLIRKLNLLKIKYADLAPTAAIAGPAAASLGLSEGEVAGAVSAAAPQDSFLLITTVQSSTRTRAQRIANAIADSVVAYADAEQQHIGVPEALRYRFSLVVPAPPGHRIQPTTGRAIQAAAALGVIAVGLSYVLLQLLTAEPRLTAKPR